MVNRIGLRRVRHGRSTWVHSWGTPVPIDFHPVRDIQFYYYR